MDISKFYKDNVFKYNKLYKDLEKKFNFYSNIKLVFVILSIALGYLINKYFNFYYLVIFGIFAVVFFIYLIYKHNIIYIKKNKNNNLIQINQHYLDRLDEKWQEFKDTGSDFVDNEHIYTFDLDIFGQSSLFQMINICNTYHGRNTLKDLLANPVLNKDEILKKQGAISELSKKHNFTQNLQCSGYNQERLKEKPDKLEAYSKIDNTFILDKWYTLCFYGLPIITILSIIAAIFIDGFSSLVPVFLLLIHLLINTIFSKKAGKVLKPIYGLREAIHSYEKIINIIESEKFENDYLKELQNKLIKDGNLASQQIKSLQKIVDIADFKYNPYLYPPINLLVFLKIHSALALEKWYAKFSNNITDWLNVIGQFEALASLSVIGQIKPNWCYPTFSSNKVDFVSKNMGHPLIVSNKMVSNDFTTSNKISIITGSNMSGKTTLLRTVGINLVLAYSGAPVCASSFNCSLMQICTSMRVSDNLSKGVSTFYAELLRIKKIIDYSKKKAPMIFLIDEIFSGTNSVDRIDGAKAILISLDKNWAVGLISTHDFELCNLENQNGIGFKNYHFSESYKQKEIVFDYKLRKGISNTRNAKYLMKIVGIY